MTSPHRTALNCLPDLARYLQDPELFASFNRQVQGLSGLAPDLREQRIILDTYSGFSLSEVSIHQPYQMVESWLWPAQQS